MTDYEGPFVNIKLSDGQTVLAQGNLDAITGQFRGGGLHTVTDVYGRQHAINGDHIVHAEESASDFPAGGGRARTGPRQRWDEPT